MTVTGESREIQVGLNQNNISELNMSVKGGSRPVADAGQGPPQGWGNFTFLSFDDTLFSRGKPT